MSANDDIRRHLDHSRAEYEFLRDQAMWAAQREQYELSARLFSAAANYAELFHSGFFVDPVAENELSRIGRSLDESAASAAGTLMQRNGSGRQDSRRSLLHVLSELSSVGGLWRTLIHWIRFDRDTRHAVVVLRQKEPQAVEWFERQLSGEAVSLCLLDPAADVSVRAMQLRALSRHGFTAVVHHVGQAEVIPTLAFATSNCPPVLYVDHADHSFWLGKAVTDIVVHQRPVGAELCDRRRGGGPCFVLPIPLDATAVAARPQAAEVNRQREIRLQARTAFGIARDQVVALTIGRRDKYRPTSDANFMREASAFIDSHPTVVLHVVGMEREQGEQWAGRRLPASRILFHGEVPVDPRLRMAADLYLESYPFGSQTAFLEAALATLAAVRAPVDTTLLATSDTAVDAVVSVPTNEAEYWNRAAALVADPDERQRLALRLHEEVVKAHTDRAFREKLEELYGRVEALDHHPAKLATDRAQLADGDDIALHRWHRCRDGAWTSNRTLRLTVKALLNDVMQQQLGNGQRELLPELALRLLRAGRADRTILKMALAAWRERATPWTRSDPD